MISTLDLDRTHFSVLRLEGRIWAVAAVRGDAPRLREVHAGIEARFQRGDRVIHLGDVMGAGPDIIGTVDEVLRFRRWVISRPPFVHPNDFVVLRGSQEEMWRNLLQVQFAAAAGDVLRWMESRGVAETVNAYGGRFCEGLVAARDGAMVLGQWTARLRDAIRATPGHGAFNAMLMRAAVTADGALLFVNAGLDPDRRLSDQGDRFWWDAGGPDRMKTGYPEARLIIRGADPGRRGVTREAFYLGLDGGSGEGGLLNAVCLSRDGKILDTISA